MRVQQCEKGRRPERGVKRYRLDGSQTRGRVLNHSSDSPLSSICSLYRILRAHASVVSAAFELVRERGSPQRERRRGPQRGYGVDIVVATMNLYTTTISTPKVD